MKTTLNVALVGDRDDAVPAHRAIPLALQLAGDACGISIEPLWVPTEQADHGAVLDGVDGIWCVLASPSAVRWTGAYHPSCWHSPKR